MAGDFDLSPQDYADDTRPEATTLTSYTGRRHPPGSHLARQGGCRCPVIENAYGRGRDTSLVERLWIISEACPVHLPTPAPAEPRE